MDQDSSAFVADRKLIQALERYSQPVPCPEDRVLFTQGEAPDGLYILRTGEAELVMRSNAGNAVICLRASAGSLLGLPAVTGNEPYSLTAMARKGSKVRFVKRDDFEDLIRSQPSLSLKVLEVLAAEVRFARQALASVDTH